MADEEKEEVGTAARAASPASSSSSSSASEDERAGPAAEVVVKQEQQGEEENEEDVFGVCAAGDVDRARELIEWGISVNARDGNKRTPLHHACAAGQLDTALFLLSAGAHINALDDTGRRTLEAAPASVFNRLLEALEKPPEWVPDADVRLRGCMVCAEPFSATRRIHHCRHCGAACCSQCTATRVALPEFGFGDTPVRVCTLCTPAVRRKRRAQRRHAEP